MCDLNMDTHEKLSILAELICKECSSEEIEMLCVGLLDANLQNKQNKSKQAQLPSPKTGGA